MQKQLNKPLVSIIIPVYNSAAYLTETIYSALNQTWENKEILIIDDGSTDSSVKIAEQFKSEAVKIFIQDNKGSCVARNKGIKESKGAFIQFLDADDLLSPNKITDQIHSSYQHPEDTLFSSPWASFKKSIKEAKFKKDILWQETRPVDWLLHAWNKGLMMQTACWLTPRKLIEDAGYWNENLKNNPNDDGEFFCRVILKSKRIHFTETSKVYYRNHDGLRVSKNTSFDAIASLLGSYNSYEKHLLRVENSQRTLNALVRIYSAFIYKYVDLYPSLTSIAEDFINKHPIKRQHLSSSTKFNMLSMTIGFKNALKARSLFKRLKGRIALNI